MDQEGLLFPKTQEKKKRKKHPPSIIPGDNPKICYVCGCRNNIERECILTFPDPRGLVEAFKRISEGLSRKRHEYFLYVPKETSDYEKNTENVVSLTGILTKRRKARGK